jgi:N-acyl-phosphatidylethanolamine-hydrolysing phospholipase D
LILSFINKYLNIEFKTSVLNITLCLCALVVMCAFSSCNLFMVAVRNVPVFFETPKEVSNKITDPIKPGVRLSALWIGHSTVLLQMDDKVIITDPVLTETVGEFARRVVEPGIDPENIPKCDIILISHSHFDHLSYSSLELLEKKSKGASLVFPYGLESFLPYYNYNFVRMENDNGYLHNIIGEQKLINGIKVSSVFAHHWGGRYGVDGYVWGDHSFTGYILEYNGMTVYFAGDTGYDSVKFKQIGNLYKIDLALIPIGPCADCDRCGPPNHVFPPDAVMIYKDTKAKWMLPIHYGTLYFAQGDPELPLISLNKIVTRDSLQNKIIPLNIGEQKIYY